MQTIPANIKSREKLDMKSGDTVRVHQKIEDKGGKTRIQIFEGIVLARKHGSEAGATFTVRRVTSGVGVEKIFPLFSPVIDKIEIVKRSKVRRSKLYHIRKTAQKQISKRMKMMFVDIKTEDETVEEPVNEETTEEPKTEEPKEESTEEETVKAPENTEEKTEEAKEEETK